MGALGAVILAVRRERRAMSCPRAPAGLRLAAVLLVFHVALGAAIGAGPLSLGGVHRSLRQRGGAPATQTSAAEAATVAADGAKSAVVGAASTAEGWCRRGRWIFPLTFMIMSTNIRDQQIFYLHITQSMRMLHVACGMQRRIRWYSQICTCMQMPCERTEHYISISTPKIFSNT